MTIFSVLDMLGAINEQDEVVSATNQLKLLALDGKKRLTDTLDMKGIEELAKNICQNYFL